MYLRGLSTDLQYRFNPIFIFNPYWFNDTVLLTHELKLKYSKKTKKLLTKIKNFYNKQNKGIPVRYLKPRHIIQLSDNRDHNGIIIPTKCWNIINNFQELGNIIWKIKSLKKMFQNEWNKYKLGDNLSISPIIYKIRSHRSFVHFYELAHYRGIYGGENKYINYLHQEYFTECYAIKEGDYKKKPKINWKLTFCNYAFSKWKCK